LAWLGAIYERFLPKITIFAIVIEYNYVGKI